MVKLTLLDSQGLREIKQWDFPTQTTIRIGRSRENDVVLDQFPKVSRHHAQLHKVAGNTSAFAWRLVSQGANGTFLNGILITQALVTDEAIIQFCKEGPLIKFQTQSLTSEVANSLANNLVPSMPQNQCTHQDNPPDSLFCIHCGSPLVKEQKLIGNYQLLRQLGQGGMGTTYIAWDKQQQEKPQPQLVVLKEMNADMATNQKARELFAREARILKGLSHSGIPQYYDFFWEEGKNYLAMELIHGHNLEQRIYEHGSVNLEQGITWMVQVCAILDYLHSLDPPLVHRDVKPANLMLRNRDGRIMLLDFGAVKELGTPFMTRIGAAGYTAPEQDKGKPCIQSDVYAVGSTLVFLLTGKEPINFYGRKGRVYGLDLSDVSAITPPLQAVIEKSCAPKLEQRYQSAQELAEALSACL